MKTEITRQALLLPAAHVRPRRILLLFLLGCLMPGVLEAQIRSGAAFLKITPGVRNQGMGINYTGVIDELHTLYANPAAGGYMREWQWSTSYTEWIADTYSLSWIYGRQVQTPWSRKTGISLGIHYQGVRSFNSTGDPSQASASASDALISLSLANRLGTISRHLSFGANLKYYRSDLDGSSANAFIADLGLLYRSPRFAVSLPGFKHGIFSAGVAVNQLGPELKYVSVTTPLPRTLRAGGALNLGSHEGLQMQLSGDYLKIRDEDGGFSLGGELAWRYAFALRGGYTFSDNLLSKLALGLSLRWGGTTPLPGRQNALRLDFAYLEDNVFFDAPLRGGLNHFTLAPEPFRLLEGYRGAYAPDDTVRLSWETASDPDLFDDVRYTLLIAKADSSELQQLVSRLAGDEVFFRDWLNNAGPAENTIRRFDLPNRSQDTPLQTLDLLPEPQHEFGDYYWSVIANDRDEHTRPAYRTGHYRVALPDLQIRSIDFVPAVTDNCVDGDSCRGTVTLRIHNAGEVPARRVAITLSEFSPQEQALLPDGGGPRAEELSSAGAIAPIALLAPGSSSDIQLPWKRHSSAPQAFFAVADPDDRITESNEANNSLLSPMPFPDLELSIATSRPGVQPGDTAAYRVTLRNTASAAKSAANIAVNLQIPEQLSVAAAQNRVLSWNIPLLAPGQDTVFVFDGVVDNLDTLREIVLTGSINGSFCDVNPGDNCITHVLPIIKYDLNLTAEAHINPLKPKVNFDTGDSTILKQDEPLLDILATALLSPHLENVFIKLGGHTDQRGGASYNKRLSQSRIRSVRNFFTRVHSMEARRFFAHGYGEGSPLTDVEKLTGQTRARKLQLHLQNRRVEMYFLTKVDTDTSNKGVPRDSTALVKVVFHGETIRYRLTIANSGKDTAVDITVTDTLPDFTTLLPSASGLQPQHSGNLLSWSIHQLKAGEEVVLEYQVRIDGDIPPARANPYRLVNNARLSAQHDRIPANNQAKDAVFVIDKPGDR